MAAQPYAVFKVATGAFPNGDNSSYSILLDTSTDEPVMLIDDGGDSV